jgi:predicted phage tail protein
VAANVTTFTTANLSRGTRYWFRVRANNQLGSSTWVNATPFPLNTP